MLLGADWSNFVVGIRQDITYKMLDQSVISDDNGKVILNLAQQDCVAMRVVFRVGFRQPHQRRAARQDEALPRLRDRSPKRVTPAPQSIETSPETVTVRAGETTNVTVRVLPEGADQTVTATVADKSIATLVSDD